MERVYTINGLDCANCAAKLERHLKEIQYFEQVIIDFMAQKLIITVKDEETLQKGLQEAEKVIARVEPGVTITEKAKKPKNNYVVANTQDYDEESCGCGHDHIHHHEESCGCGHDHDHHERESCGCGHDHDHHEGESCGCGHDHVHHHEDWQGQMAQAAVKKTEKVYAITGLDCANCAAKLERHLKEIQYFDQVTIDFMAQKLILQVKDERQLPEALHAVRTVIDHVEPGVTITEKGKKVSNHTQAQSHEHGANCHCGHDHTHTEPCDDSDGRQEKQTLLQEGKKEAAITKAKRFTPEMQKSLWKIIVSAVLFAAATFLPNQGALQFDALRLGIYLLAYIIVGGEIVLRAAKNIVRGQVFDENFLMSVATIGAFAVGEYPEGVMVMLLYQLGELFQDYAVHRSRRSIADLMDIKPEVAHVQQGDRFVSVEPEEVAVGNIIQIRPGEKIPLDGLILEGTSSLNTVALTGESVPREVAPGQEVMSGCINTSGVLTVRVEKEYEDSTVAKILDLVENASSKKAETENFITRFARYYTPAVVGIAVVLALLPPVILQAPFQEWIYRALVFLVISCPCALVISIPLTFFGGLGACSRHGVLVKGSNYLEALAKLECAVFDKTGTLTKGEFSVTEVRPIEISREQLLYYAACAESVSNHPIALAIRRANSQHVSAKALQKAEEIAGYGISAMVEGHAVLAGNYRFMKREQISCQRAEETGTIIYIAVDGVFCGSIVIADEIKPDAQTMIGRLKQLGVRDIVMLTGDNQQTAEQVARQLGITKVFSQLLPGDKVHCLEKLLQQKSEKRTVAFTGDGLNDAPVLARADVGIAMGGLGSDAAIEAADVVIMNDQPSKLADAIVIAKETRRIVQQNIVFILAVKAIVLLLGAVGIATMWMAVFADVGVAVLAILNAVRIMRK